MNEPVSSPRIRVPEMIDYKKIPEKIKKFEEIMEHFFRQDPIEYANKTLRNNVEDYNLLIATKKQEFKKRSDELEAIFQTIKENENQIKEYDKRLENEKPDQQIPDSIEAYNQKVQDRNRLVEKQKELVDEYNSMHETYAKEVDEFNKTSAQKNSQLDDIEKKNKENASNYQQWISSSGPEKFYGDINRFYASLQKEKRDNKDNIPDLDDHVFKIGKIRKELGVLTQSKHKSSLNGLLIVETTVCNSETSYMLVDTGASLTSLTDEMVDILNLREFIGEEIEITLPNALRIKAPQLLIPGISVNGMQAEYIKGIVLRESIAGVDGCLGLSFLDRFDWSIHMDGTSKYLVLKLPGRHEIKKEFDVFICYKTEALDIAEQVFNILTEAGYNPFLSHRSLEKIGTTEYQKAIDNTLETVDHFVVICSSAEHLNTPWVEAEWRLFEGLKRSGKKKGNIIPVLCENITENDLPFSLQRYNAVKIDDLNFKKTIMNYLPR